MTDAEIDALVARAKEHGPTWSDAGLLVREFCSRTVTLVKFGLVRLQYEMLDAVARVLVPLALRVYEKRDATWALVETMVEENP